MQIPSPNRRLRLLDIGCGSGNQLVANLPQAPDGCLVGVDRYYGMLRQARPNSDAIRWIQADGAGLPLHDATFGLITNQYSFHHVADKPSMLREVFRVLERSGWFVLTNLCPTEMLDWAFYGYFPAARDSDLQDFLPPDDIRSIMEQTGFQRISVNVEHFRYETTLKDFTAGVRRRDICSQLMTISDADYQNGLENLDREVAAKGEGAILSVHGCLVKMVGIKP